MDRSAAISSAPALSVAGLPAWQPPARARRWPILRRPTTPSPIADTGSSRAATLPELDHHAEAGAPEGALYVDGVLFGFSGSR